MKNKLLSLSKTLIEIESIAGNESALQKSLEVALLELKGFTIERFEENGVQSALIYTAKKRPTKFKIILNAHLDVIPGKKHQYIPQVKGDRLYGTGALDMKANLVCFVLAFKEVANNVSYPIGLQLVTDEELGGIHGTKYQVDSGVKADFVIAGETTNFDIVNKAKGVLWVKISTTGKTAHGAYPWRGKNSIWEMNKFLTSLGKAYPIPEEEKWTTTINLSRIQTNNQTFNKIPDDCEVWLDIRYVPEDTNTILNNIKKLLPVGFKMEVITKEPAMLVDENNSYIKNLQQIGKGVIGKNIITRGAQGTSDARHFTSADCDGIEFGPVGGGIGSDEEWIDISSLEKYHIILTKFLLSLQT